MGSLNRLDLIDADLNLFSIKSSGTDKHLEVMAELLVDEGRNVVLIVDGDKAGSDKTKIVDKINSRLRQKNSEFSVNCIQLETNKSIEDYLPDKELLKLSVIQGVEELISNGFRDLKQGLNPEDIPEITAAAFENQGTTTLGYVIDDVTESLMGDDKPISKVLIARKYSEHLAKLESENALKREDFSQESISLANEIVVALKLKEKSAQKLIVN